LLGQSLKNNEKIKQLVRLWASNPIFKKKKKKKKTIGGWNAHHNLEITIFVVESDIIWQQNLKFNSISHDYENILEITTLRPPVDISELVSPDAVVVTRICAIIWLPYLLYHFVLQHWSLTYLERKLWWLLMN